MSTLRHETTNHDLSHYESTTEYYGFADRTTDVRIGIAHYVHQEEAGREFTRADIHFDPVDDGGQSDIVAQQIDAGRDDAFWALNIGPATIYLTNEDRRRLIDALIDGEWL